MESRDQRALRQRSPPLVVDPEAKRYVVIPLTPRADGALMFTAKLGGRDLDLKLDLTNKVSVFKKRTLDKLEISLEKTMVRIPTQRGDRYLYEGRVIGLEFDGKSTGPIEVKAADLDAIYGTAGGIAPRRLVRFGSTERPGRSSGCQVEPALSETEVSRAFTVCPEVATHSDRSGAWFDPSRRSPRLR